MKRISLLLIAFALTTLTVGQAKAQQVDVGLESAIIYQALDHSNDDGSLGDLAPGFQNAVGNISVGIAPFDGGVAHVGLFISSKHHTETWGYEGYFKMDKLPEWMELGKLGTFYDEHLSVRAGQMALDFSDSHLYQSVNGAVYDNELIGNPVAVPALVALGMEATYKANDLFQVMAGFSNGTTKGDISEGKGIAFHGKATVTPMAEKLRFSLSGYRVDHSANGTGYPAGGTKSYLFSQGDRAGSRYDIWSGPDGGQIFFGKEQDVTVFQLDGRVDLKPFLLYGAVGTYNDEDGNGTAFDETGAEVDNGTPVDQWNFAMITGKYNITDWLYLAGRYSTARASKLADVEVDGVVNRIQVGAGFKLYEGILMKAEYVNQTTSGFNTGYSNGGADLGLNPEFSGFSIETAVKL